MTSGTRPILILLAILALPGACGGQMDPAISNPTPYESPAPTEPTPAPASPTPGEPSDPGEPSVTATCPPAGRSNLEAGFCTADCPCDIGQGGCASDDHCKGELVCATEAEFGWLRRCAELTANKADGASCLDDGDCESRNCGCDRFSNIFTCLPVTQPSACTTSSFECDTNQSSDHGESCAGVPAETWRCVQSAGKWPGESLSQVCRAGIWQTYNRNPRDCAACCGDFSVACAHL